MTLKYTTNDQLSDNYMGSDASFFSTISRPCIKCLQNVFKSKKIFQLTKLEAHIRKKIRLKS